MIFRLIVLNGDRKGRQITVERTPMVIGQDPAAAICIPDEEVARRHASIVHREDGKLLVHDLGSMNRVLVNGRAVAEAELKHGDTIELGRTRLLVQALVQAEVDASPKPDPVEDDLLPRHRFPVGLIMNGLLIAALAVAVVTWHRSTRTHRSAQPVPNPLALDTYLTATGSVSNTPAPIDAAVPPPAVASENLPTGSGLIVAATSAPPPMNVATTTVSMPPVATEKLDRIEQELASMRATMQKLSNATPVIAEVAYVTNAPIQPTPPPHPEPKPSTGTLVPRPGTLAPADVRAVVLVDLMQNKFPATEEFEEMRVVKADLQATPANAPIDALRVVVTFFDRLDRDGTIVPTRAIVTPKSVQPAGEPGAGQYSAGATYVVPRRSDKAPSRAASYYGFSVRVYDGKRLLAADARPRHLLGESDASRKPTP